MEKSFTIRQTTEADYAALYDLIKTAFETAEHRDGTEQDFAVSLRNGENYIPRLDLVADLDGQLVGHIMFTKTHVSQSDGSRYETLLVAPLSVLIAQRRSGVGSALMLEGLRIAAAMGYQTAFLIGDPDYYRRFGYKLSNLYGIVHDSLPAEYIMVKEMKPDALRGITGKINM